jgi:beta-phosphoglucomutase-like phosphatase (HAD superfamily)
VREGRKEEERMMCERQREEERLKREQRREIERREKYMMKEHLRVSFNPHVIALLNQIDLKINSVAYYTFLWYVLMKAEKRKQKEEIRKEKEAERRKAAL